MSVSTEILSENTAFKKVMDTIYDSKVFTGLVSSGILPQSFRSYKTAITLPASTLAFGSTYFFPFLGKDGEPIELTDNTLIVYGAMAASTAITLSAGLPANAAVGLTLASSSTSGAAVVNPAVVIDGSAITVTLFNGASNGAAAGAVTSQTTVVGGNATASTSYYLGLALTVSTANVTLSGGVVDLFLITV